METDMPLWFWLNVPLMIVFFAAWTGIPLWLVLTRWNRTDRPATRQPQPQHRPRPQSWPAAGSPARPRQAQLTH
jgi:hypothetical protein